MAFFFVYVESLQTKEPGNSIRPVSIFGALLLQPPKNATFDKSNGN